MSGRRAATGSIRWARTLGRVRATWSRRSTTSGSLAGNCEPAACAGGTSAAPAAPKSATDSTATPRRKPGDRGLVVTPWLIR